MVKRKKGYYRINGNEYPSVTTVLQIINKPALMFWYGKLGTQEATRQGKQATGLGSRVHKRIEQHFADKQYSVRGKEQQPMTAFFSWLAEHDVDCSISEHTVHSDTYEYAGTLDFLGTIDGKRVIADFKTSARIYPEVQLQLQAYRVAHEEMGGSVIEEMHVVRLDKVTGKYQTKIYLPDEGVFCAFKNAMDLWKWKYKK